LIAAKSRVRLPERALAAGFVAGRASKLSALDVE